MKSLGFLSLPGFPLSLVLVIMKVRENALMSTCGDCKGASRRINLKSNLGKAKRKEWTKNHHIIATIISWSSSTYHKCRWTDQRMVLCGALSFPLSFWIPWLLQPDSRFRFIAKDLDLAFYKSHEYRYDYHSVTSTFSFEMMKMMECSGILTVTVFITLVVVVVTVDNGLS